MAATVEISYELAGLFIDMNPWRVLRVDKDDARRIATFHVDLPFARGPHIAVVHRIDGDPPRLGLEALSAKYRR